MAEVAIKPCDGARCDSSFQDQRYGFGRRVFNRGTTNTDRGTCTVCGTDKILVGDGKTKKKGKK